MCTKELKYITFQLLSIHPFPSARRPCSNPHSERNLPWEEAQKCYLPGKNAVNPVLMTPCIQWPPVLSDHYPKSQWQPYNIGPLIKRPPVLREHPHVVSGPLIKRPHVLRHHFLRPTHSVLINTGTLIKRPPVLRDHFLRPTRSVLINTGPLIKRPPVLRHHFKAHT